MKQKADWEKEYWKLWEENGLTNLDGLIFEFIRLQIKQARQEEILIGRNENRVTKVGRKEVWRPVVGYEGLYEVSNFGRISSFLKVKSGGEPKLLKLGCHPHHHFSVGLTKNNKSKTFKVHRIVAEAFIPNPYNYNCINHIDGNRTNNRIDNLEWCTYSQNNQHAWDIGLNKGWTGKLMPETTKQKLSLISKEQWKKIRFDREEKARIYWLNYIKEFGHQPKLKEMATDLGYECWETAGRYIRKLRREGRLK